MFEIRSARPQELTAALRLLFRRFGPDEAEERARRTTASVAAGEVPAEGVLVAHSGEGITGCCVAVPIPGAAGLIWPPSVSECPERTFAEDCLVRAALDRLWARGVKVAQTMLLPDEADLAPPLERNGVPFVTRLLYLHHALDEPPPENPAHAPAMECVAYDDAGASIFHETLLRSYEGSLDCPELEGARSAEEILDGHRAHGIYQPQRWWLALSDARPVAVVLLADVPEWGGWDLGYLGVVPEARGRGIGRALTCRALAAARDAGAGQFTLTVDERNLPARALYGRLGFEQHDERLVYLAFPDR